MRINIYSQELTMETKLVSKEADTGVIYYGVRMFLASPSVLHHTQEDDDRSAITFWIPNAKTLGPMMLAKVFHDMAQLIEQTQSIPKND